MKCIGHATPDSIAMLRSKCSLGTVTSDPERIVRFEREAKTLAALNHPHIAHVYGFEDTSSDAGEPARALIMELVQGEDLGQRIARGAMPISDAISVARQIVDGVMAAHEKGIIHRDLKPANIKVTADGTVKVLDFGLAKKVEPESAGVGTAPTITSAPTLPGVILGTAAYMSPEQARGQAVDARTDIWAFGCVLYEMLSGRRAFAGATVSDTIAKVLERDPEWAALPPSTPPSLKRLLTRCLEKDPKRRLHALADAHFELDEAIEGTTLAVATTIATPATRFGRRSIVVTLVAVLAIVVAWTFFPLRTMESPPPRVLPLTSYPGIEDSPAFSPDGKQVAFSWDGDHGDNENIYVLIVGADSPHPITQAAARDVSPAWKPDGSQIAFARLDAGRAAIYGPAARRVGTEARGFSAPENRGGTRHFRGHGSALVLVC